MSTNPIDRGGPAFEQLKAVLEDWAIEYGICPYPDALANDAAEYVRDQLLGATEERT